MSVGAAVVWAISLVVVGIAAWWLSGRRSRARVGMAIREFADRIRRGVAAGSYTPTDPSLPALEVLREAFAVGYVPRGAEGLATAGAAVACITFYLEEMAARPLRAAVPRAEPAVRSAIHQALAAIEEIRTHIAADVRELAPHDLRQVLQEVVDEFTRDSRSIVKLISPDAPVRVRLDKEPFKDAVYLILLNAEQFSGAKPVDLRISVESGVTRVVIRDRGPGFNAEALSRAIDPFYTTQGAALGLGLSHALQVILAHLGELRLQNQQGSGAEVEITLPLAH